MEASRGGELPREWFDAISSFDSQADELEFQANVARDKARLKASGPRGR